MENCRVAYAVPIIREQPNFKAVARHCRMPLPTVFENEFSCSQQKAAVISVASYCLGFVAPEIEPASAAHNPRSLGYHYLTSSRQLSSGLSQRVGSGDFNGVSPRGTNLTRTRWATWELPRERGRRIGGERGVLFSCAALATGASARHVDRVFAASLCFLNERVARALANLNKLPLLRVCILVVTTDFANRNERPDEFKREEDRFKMSLLERVLCVKSLWSQFLPSLPNNNTHE